MPISANQPIAGSLLSLQIIEPVSGAERGKIITHEYKPHILAQAIETGFLCDLKSKFRLNLNNKISAVHC
jgi:hypothetical protein